MGIFADWASRYTESGFSVIPTYGKKPCISGHQAYSERIPTQEEIDLWITNYGNNGISLVCGAASKIVCVDIDVDGEEVEGLAMSALPRTPCRKRGAKGVTLFYRFHPSLDRSQAINFMGGRAVDILSNGKYTVIPPSIHADTKEPYRWIGFDLLSSMDDIPEITQDHVNLFGAKLVALLDGAVKRGTIDEKTKERIAQGRVSGRNDRMVAITSAKIFDRKSPNDVIAEIIKADKEEHPGNPLFQDSSENSGCTDPFLNAFSFYYRNMKSLSKSGKNITPAFDETHKIQDEHFNESDIADAPLSNLMSYPMPEGLLGTITKYLMATAPRPNEVLSIGSAITLLSSVCCNHVMWDGTWPSLFSMLVAETGAGKDRPFKGAEEIIKTVNPAIVGGGYYASDASILRGLSNKTNVWFYPMDECGDFIKMATDQTGRSYERRVGDTLTSLWSSSPTSFAGKVTAMNGIQGACNNPCINILGTTNPTAFRAGITRDAFNTGFLGRFLFFVAGKGPRNKLHRKAVAESKITGGVFEKIIGDLQFIRSLGGTKGNLETPKPLPLSSGPGFEEAVDAYIDEIDSLSEKYDDQSIIKPVINRMIEQALRLSVVHCASRMAIERKILDIDVKDLEWSKGVLKSILINLEGFVDDNVGGGDELTALVIRVVKASGKTGVGHTALWKSCGRENPVSFRKLVDGLVKENILLAKKITAGHNQKRPSLFYFLLK